MNINALPDVVLRHIFTRFTLLDQLHLHHVCPRWKCLQSSVTCTRKSLTLFVGEQKNPNPRSLISDSNLTIPHLDQIGNSPQKESNILEFSKLNIELVAHLVNLFPNISSLCIVLNQTGCEVLDQVILLLEIWSENLTEFSFYGHFDADNDNDEANFVDSSKQLHKLIRFINQKCLLLDRLTLDISARLYQVKESFEKKNILDMPCLARLKEFQFCSFDSAEILFKSLKQYGTSDRLKRISVGNLYGETDLLDQIGVQIARKFIALPQFTLPETRLRQVFNTFTSLTALWFDLGDTTLPEFTAYLAPLHNLTHLNLTIDYKILSQYDETPTYEFHRLSSVKILVLMLSTRSHTYLASRHWSTIFPSIELVEIYHFGVPCQECGQIGALHGLISQTKRAGCLKMLIGPLKQCDKLKKIVTYDYFPSNDDGDRKEWTIKELD